MRERRRERDGEIETERERKPESFLMCLYLYEGFGKMGSPAVIPFSSS